MMTRNYGKQIKFHTLTIEHLVPEDHFLRKLDRLVDFSFIYEETKEYYCHHNGRPSIDPVILVKYLLVGYLYGIKSERRMKQEIEVNMAYRWFLGLDIKTAGADSAYGTSLIYQAMEDMGIHLHTPGATGGVNYKVEFTREALSIRKE